MTPAVNVGALLALVLAVRHYGWMLAPAADRADLWYILGAAAVAVLAFGWALWARSSVVWGLWLILAWHELSVGGCSVAYIVSPWPVPLGEDQCAALVAWDLRKLGAIIKQLGKAFTTVGRKLTTLGEEGEDEDKDDENQSDKKRRSRKPSK